MFERIKRFYNETLWNQWQVWKAVEYEAITSEDYFMITGEKYDANISPPQDGVNK